MATNICSIYFQMQAIGEIVTTGSEIKSLFKYSVKKPFLNLPTLEIFGILWYSSILFKEKIRQNNTNELKEKKQH